MQIGMTSIPTVMPSLQMNMLAIEEIRKQANQENERSKMLVTLLEEVLNDYTAT
jgi:hypothetical protein